MAQFLSWKSFGLILSLIFLITHLLYEVDIAAHIHFYLCTCERFLCKR